jgi:hypothetical protein
VNLDLVKENLELIKENPELIKVNLELVIRSLRIKVFSYLAHQNVLRIVAHQLDVDGAF